MAVYKVPQDVEADDKLIGPFSFRQFIYLIIVALSIAGAWGLAQLFIGLAIIPLPLILFFGALALPLRKDQPMEIYMAAIVAYYIKPRKRMWDPDGIDSLIEITTPKTVERSLTKGISQADAEQRISYLANLVDSGGWAIRGVQGPSDSPVNNDVFLEAQNIPDVLDTSNSVAQTFDAMMTKRTNELKEEAREHMYQTFPAPEVNPFLTPQPAASPSYDPYPASIQQTVIQPLNDPSHTYTPHQQTHIAAPTPAANPVVSDPVVTTTPVEPPVTTEPATTTPPVAETEPTTTSDKAVSPDIMNLANNPDLSIETIAHEAHRIHEKEHNLEDGEVVISLR